MAHSIRSESGRGRPIGADSKTSFDVGVPDVLYAGARVVKKLVLVAALKSFAQRTLMKSGPRGLLPVEIPSILNICCEPIARCPRRLLCRFPLVVLQQAHQSFSTPHCSDAPPCL